MQNLADEFAAGYLLGRKNGKGKLTTKTITDNGTYKAKDEPVEEDEKKYDGYSEVTVNLALGSKSIVSNDTYTASSDGLKGYSSVTVNVPTYAQEYQEALARIDELEEQLGDMTDGFEEKADHLYQLTGVKATTFAELDILIDEAVREGGPEPHPEIEIPNLEIDPTNPETTPEEIVEEEERVADENDQPVITDEWGEDDSNPDNIRSYFGIKGLGWYSLRIDKNNTFEPTCMWYNYAMCFNTEVRVIVTKFDEHGDETIVANRTLDTHSHGNYNWAYDPDYIGNPGTPPGTNKGWHGNYSSPSIRYRRDGNTLYIEGYRWSISGGGGMSGNWSGFTITLT